MSDPRTTSERLVDPRIFGPLFILLTATLSGWFANQNLPNPDESANLAAAAKILQGQVFYRDIDAYPFPGSAYILALWMSALGEHVGAARALAALVFCGFSAALYACAVQLLDRRSAALFALSLLSFKFLAFPNFTAYLYSDMALAFAAAAIALFLRSWPDGSVRSLGAVGALVGAAVLCKQNTGLYVGVAIGVLLLFPRVALAYSTSEPRERLSHVLAFATGGLAALAPALLYFASEGLVDEMLYSGLVRPFTGYLPTSGVAFAPLLAWWEFGALEGTAAQPYFPLRYSEMLYADLLPAFADRETYWRIGEFLSRALYTSIPLVFGVWAWRWIRGATSSDASRAHLLAYAGLAFAVVASAFPRADFPHIVNVYPVFLLAAFGLAQATPRARLAKRVLACEGAAVAVLLLVVGAQLHWYNGALTHRLELERASLRVKAQDAWVGAVIPYLTDQVPPGEPLFVYGHEAYFYFLTDRYFPWPFLQLYPGMAGGDEGRELARQLALEQPRFVVKGVLRWPGMPDLARDTPLLANAIQQSYRRTEAWRRVTGPAFEPPSNAIFALLERREFESSPALR